MRLARLAGSLRHPAARLPAPTPRAPRLPPPSRGVVVRPPGSPPRPSSVAAAAASSSSSVRFVDFASSPASSSRTMSGVPSDDDAAAAATLPPLAPGGSSSAPDSSASRVIKRETTHATRWLAMRHLTYVDPAGAERGWDSVARSTRSPGAVADAVCVFATLRRANEPDRVLLVRQFRPPLDAETIELPAGLIDGDEAPEIAALRELKEETGYVGTLTTEGTTGTTGTTTTPAMPLSPGLSDETVCLVRVDVDLDAPENAHPKQELEGSEFITVYAVPKDTLRAQLDQLAARGYKVFAGLYLMALGMEMGRG